MKLSIIVPSLSGEMPKSLQGELPSDYEVVKVIGVSPVGMARNEGLKRATGEFITFVDADDDVKVGVYSEAIAKLDGEQADVCTFGSRTIWTDEGLYMDNVDPTDFPVLWNKVYRASSIKGVTFDETACQSEDCIFNLEVRLKGTKWVRIDLLGYTYYRYNGSLLTRYVPNVMASLEKERQLWLKLGEKPIYDEHDILSGEWRNIWMRGTPYSLIGRYKWLKVHPQLGGGLFFVKTIARQFIRRWFYIRPIRRSHLKRAFPGVRDWNGNV